MVAAGFGVAIVPQSLEQIRGRASEESEVLEPKVRDHGPHLGLLSIKRRRHRPDLS
jgi:hypothetical protein